jgi:peptide deformylase
VVNPVIISESGKKEKKKESCLSIPNHRGIVERRHKLHLSFQNRFGELQEMDVEGFLARVFFHEIDHLDGILFVDRMDKDSELEYVDFKWE